MEQGSGLVVIKRNIKPKMLRSRVSSVTRGLWSLEIRWQGKNAAAAPAKSMSSPELSGAPASTP